MSLPPLPKEAVPAIGIFTGDGYYSCDQMQAYGKQCREVALKDAASICEGEKWNDSGKPVNYIKAFNEGCTDCATVIRRLK